MIISSTTCPKILLVLLEAVLLGSDPMLTEVNKSLPIDYSLLWIQSLFRGYKYSTGGENPIPDFLIDFFFQIFFSFLLPCIFVKWNLSSSVAFPNLHSSDRLQASRKTSLNPWKLSAFFHYAKMFSIKQREISLCQIGVMMFQRFWLVSRLPVKILVALQTSCGWSTPLLEPPLIILWLQMEESLNYFGPALMVLGIINSTLSELIM